MNNKIIFLDIFGVLATPKSGSSFDEDCFLTLKEILLASKADIILTTSFRKNERFIEQFRNHLSFHGICPDCLSGVTPDLKYVINWLSNEELRSREIQRYIENEDMENYIIIDDMDLNPHLSKEQKKQFIRTETEIGLTKKLAKKCRDILNK